MWVLQKVPLLGIFLSTLSLRRATLGAWKSCNVCRNFYPRSPCGERPGGLFFFGGRKRFLSTLSLRRATRLGLLGWLRVLDFYPRSPCGERQQAKALKVAPLRISIHALLAESDYVPVQELRVISISIHALLAESDNKHAQQPTQQEISIHALLAESDSKSAQNSGALLRIWNKFYGDCIFMLTGKAVFYPFCPCFFHIFWCEGTENFMIAFPSH